ncbi:AMP-binding protein [Streptomyces sp. NBC_01003]|uniref:AMP-binding protein n=1 Tax=Streptomyces sp. NBC_01003 TaxID=2903714 RepID=UPI00386332B7
MSSCAAPSARWPRNAPTAVHDLGLAYAQTRPTWSELAHRIDRVVGGLGVEPGARVAALAANSAEWIVSYLAACRADAVFVGLDTWYAAGGLDYILRQSRLPRAPLCRDTVRRGSRRGRPSGRHGVSGPRAPVVIGTPQPSEGLLAHDMTARWMGKHPELGRVSFVNEQIALSGHTGTHLDATRGCGATGTGSTPRHAAPS